MNLDNQQQKQFLLELIQQTNFPGKFLDFVYEMKQAITAATITPPKNDDLK